MKRTTSICGPRSFGNFFCPYMNSDFINTKSFFVFSNGSVMALASFDHDSVAVNKVSCPFLCMCTYMNLQNTNGKFVLQLPALEASSNFRYNCYAHICSSHWFLNRVVGKLHWSHWSRIRWTHWYTLKAFEFPYCGRNWRNHTSFVHKSQYLFYSMYVFFNYKFFKEYLHCSSTKFPGKCAVVLSGLS